MVNPSIARAEDRLSIWDDSQSSPAFPCFADSTPAQIPVGVRPDQFPFALAMFARLRGAGSADIMGPPRSRRATRAWPRLLDTRFLIWPRGACIRAIFSDRRDSDHVLVLARPWAAGITDSENGPRLTIALNKRLRPPNRPKSSTFFVLGSLSARGLGLSLGIMGINRDTPAGFLLHRRLAFCSSYGVLRLCDL